MKDMARSPGDRTVWAARSRFSSQSSELQRYFAALFGSQIDETNARRFVRAQPDAALNRFVPKSQLELAKAVTAGILDCRGHRETAPRKPLPRAGDREP